MGTASSGPARTAAMATEDKANHPRPADPGGAIVALKRIAAIKDTDKPSANER